MRGRKMADEPRCRGCGEVKLPGEFVQDPRYKSGHQPWCKACRAAYKATRVERDRALFRYAKYGITPELQVELLDAQGGLCVCGVPITLANAHLDHCHASGRVRGFLCPACNHTLGQAEDDPARLRALADYVERSLL